MDERVLKWSTVLSGLLTLIVGISLYFMPDIHEKAVLAAEQQREIGNGNLVAKEANPEDVVETEEDLKSQLKIGLPKELTKDQIEIEADYVSQTVYIRFEGGVEDYFNEYAIKGSSDHIDSLSYYKDDGTGVVALELDSVYELKENYEHGSLYLDFIDPHDIYDKVIVVDA